MVENRKSVQEVSKHHGKTDVRYWQSRLFKPWYTRDGEKRELDQYAIKIQHKDLRDTFNLGTPNKAAAAAKAREIYVYLTANVGTLRLLGSNLNRRSSSRRMRRSAIFSTNSKHEQNSIQKLSSAMRSRFGKS